MRSDRLLPFQRPRTANFGLALTICLGFCCPALPAQTAIQTTTLATFPTAVPTLVRYTGESSSAAGQRIAVRFAIYGSQSGRDVLWNESQSVTIGSDGKFTVLLGAGSSDGLPEAVFAGSEPRWLGIAVAGAEEQPRVLIASVPYALKASDAETLAGRNAGEFVTRDELSSLLNARLGSVTTVPAASVGDAVPAVHSDAASAVTTTGGTSNYLPLFTSANTIASSEIYDTGTSVGIGVISNAAVRLDVGGGMIMRGGMTVSRTGNATAAKGYPSYPFGFYANAYNSSTRAADNPHFLLQSEPTGNNTASTGATFNLLYSNRGSAPTETGFSVTPTGILNFASGQTFPGTGDVTSVALSAPTSDFIVGGSPVTQSGTLGFNWNIAPTDTDTASAIVKRNSNGGFVAGMIDSNGGLNATSTSSATAAVYADNQGGGTGVYGIGNVGVFGTGTVGFATDSNVQQARTAGGWVKAMVYVDAYHSPHSIRECFNSTLTGAAATTPPCGITFNEIATGQYTLDFDFVINDRFFSVTPGFSPSSKVIVQPNTGTQLAVYATTSSDEYAQSLFWLLVY